MLFSLACFLILAVFLVCLGLFALAVTKVVAPDGRGHARGFVGLAATVGALALGNVRHWNPIERIEVFGDHEHHENERWTTPSFDEQDGLRTPASPRRALYARFVVRGEAGTDLAALLGRMIDLDLERLRDTLRVSTRIEADGSEVRLYEFRLPIRTHEVERFEDNLRLELDGLNANLPAGVRIEFEGTHE